MVKVRHAIDVDDVVRGFTGGVAQFFGDNPDTSWSTSYNSVIDRYFNGDRTAFTLWMENTCDWASLPLGDPTVPAGLVKLHHAGHTNAIVSATQKPGVTVQWFRSHYLDHLVHEWHWMSGPQKRWVLTDSIIDDNPEVLEAAARFDHAHGWFRVRVVMDRPWNYDLGNDVAVRVGTFAEYADLMIEMFGDKSV